MEFPNKRKNHLKSKILIDQLFSKGKVITKPPFRLIYLNVADSDFAGVQTLISVPKRRFKLAVTRNAIKRRISESFRLNSSELNHLVNQLNTHIAIGVIYIGKQELNSSLASKKMNEVLEELCNELKDCDE